MSFCKNKKKTKQTKKKKRKKKSILQFLNAKIYHISFSIITIFVNLSTGTYTHFRNIHVLLYPKNGDLCHSISYIQ